jgi:nucleoside-diphosphate-sugar epimerase
MCNNLIIGNTSQLSYYFPKDYLRISPRNIRYDLYKKDIFNRVYLLFAEQRTYDKSLRVSDFIDVNVTYTCEVIDFFTSRAKKVIVYGTGELWNLYHGPVDMNFKFNNNQTPYIISKEILSNKIKKYNNVIMVHPFNFNSIYRKHDFLFYKIFDSLLNNRINNFDNININRDIIHAKYVVEKSIHANYNIMIGSGVLTNIEEFTEKLFRHFKKDYRNFIKINKNNQDKQNKQNEFWFNTTEKYHNLMTHTLLDFL